MKIQVEPLECGTTAEIRSFTTLPQYNFTITVTKVTNPSGETSVTSAQNAYMCTYNYKFDETGFYQITCTSRKTSTSTPQQVTFFVRVY